VGYFEVEDNEDASGSLLSYNDLLLPDMHLKIIGQGLAVQTRFVSDLGINE